VTTAGLIAWDTTFVDWGCAARYDWGCGKDPTEKPISPQRTLSVAAYQLIDFREP